MAAPQRIDDNLHPTTDSNFRNDQYDQKNIFANTNSAPRPFGVQKAEKVVSLVNFSSKQVPKRSPKNQIKSFTTRDDISNSQLYPANIVSKPVSKKGNVLLKTAAFARAIISGIAALSWTFWLWLFVQLPFAIFSLLAMGLWAYSEEVWWMKSLSGIIGLVLRLFGVEIEIYASLFFISWSVAMGAGVIAVGGVLLQYLISLLHPMSGRGAEFKTMTLCWALVGCLIPGLNMFPWIWIYILVVMRYPK